MAVSYFDFDMIKSNKFNVINNNLIEVTEFTLNHEGGKDFGEKTYFRREGTANREDYIDTKLSKNIFTEFEIGWGTDVPDRDDSDVFYPALWTFNEDGIVISTFLGLGELMGLDVKDLSYSYSYAIYENENKLIIYTEDAVEGNELFIWEYEFDEDEYSMIFNPFFIKNGEWETIPDYSLLFWGYPYVNAKVIEKENNEAGLFFLSIPDSELWSEQTSIAKENMFVWGHDMANLEMSSTSLSEDNEYQIAAVNSGFEFSLETFYESGYRPAIGFNAFFEFTPENLGNEIYYEFAKELEKMEDNGETIEGWCIPDSTVLTDLGIHIYTNVNDQTTDITDKASYGIYLDDESNSILFSYGAVMVDNDRGLQGKELFISDEGELVWSDGNADGSITGNWWIGVGPYAGGCGTAKNPYRIETAEQFYDIRENLDKHFILIDHIDLSDYDDWEPLGAFEPLSDNPEDAETPNPEKAFTGTLNGNGFTVSNVKINQEDEDDIAIGLFGCVVGTTTKIIAIDGINCDNCLKKVRNALESIEGVQSYDVEQGSAVVVLDREIEDSIFEEAINDMVDGHYSILSIDTAIVKDITLNGKGCDNCRNGIKEVLLETEGIYRVDIIDSHQMIVLLNTDIENDELVTIANSAGHAAQALLAAEIPASTSIYNLNVEDVDITGSMLVGAVVGYQVGSVLEDIFLTGDNTITGKSMVGGIVGGAGSGRSNQLIGCEAVANIVVTVSDAGILGGGLEGCVIEDSKASGTITAEVSVSGIGGLVGCSYDGAYVKNSHVSDVIITIVGDSKLIGGLLGYAGTEDDENPMVISGCTVNDIEIILSEGTSHVGGIVGGGFSITEDELDAILAGMGFSDEEYDAYYEMYSIYLTPSVFEVEDCNTAGSITGGFEYIGSIAGMAEGSEVKDSCTSTMTWDDGVLEPIGVSE